MQKQWAWTLLYRASLVLLLVLFIGLLVVTPIDTISQSQSSGQFWNVIIIVVAYALTVVIAIVLYVSRLLKSRRSLNDIPRRFIPAKDDLPKESGNLIEQELERCMEIAHDTLPTDQHISHPGLMNPTISKGQFDAPYEQVTEIMCSFIEYKTRMLYPEFDRPKGMAIREYVLWLLESDIIDNEQVTYEFITVYERLRFSDRLIDEMMFDEYMEKCVKLLFAIQQPDSFTNVASNTTTTKEQWLSNPFDEELNRHLTKISTALSPYATNFSRRSESDTSSVIRHGSSDD